MDSIYVLFAARVAPQPAVGPLSDRRPGPGAMDLGVDEKDCSDSGRNVIQVSD
jgi:hypothetical protein